MFMLPVALLTIPIKEISWNEVNDAFKSFLWARENKYANPYIYANYSDEKYPAHSVLSHFLFHPGTTGLFSTTGEL